MIHLILPILSAPAPLPRAAKPAPYLPGVYWAEGHTSPATLYLHPDGTYGSIWGESHWEGTWSRRDNKIHIMERHLGTQGEYSQWVIDLPGIKGTSFTLRRLYHYPPTHHP